MEDTAVNMAHRYANHAEECMENNQWEQAVDMHFQAAEHFLLATKDTQNQEVIRTLKLMNANHIRQAKDLQRRITKAAAAQAAATAAAEAFAAASLAPPQKPISTRTKKDESDPFNKFWDAVENLVLKISSPVAFTSIPLDGDDPLNSASGLLSSPISEEPPLLSPTEAPSSGPGVGAPRMLDPNLKVPRYFPSNSSQSLPRPAKPRADPSPMQESFFIIDSPSLKNAQLKNPSSRSRSTSASESSTLSSSSPYKPASSGLRKGETVPRNATKTLEEYAIENQQLKLTLDKLSRRNLKLEKHLEGVMQMSVWTKDVQRSAMQLIKSQDILRPVKQSIQDLSAGKLKSTRMMEALTKNHSLTMCREWGNRKRWGIYPANTDAGSTRTSDASDANDTFQYDLI
ncbi:hypothetical protein EC968_008140 [Mortierella alpina]|nr:hypothetical protein EC968_008140 [Mortierella alpina]